MPSHDPLDSNIADISSCLHEPCYIILIQLTHNYPCRVLLQYSTPLVSSNPENNPSNRPSPPSKGSTEPVVQHLGSGAISTSLHAVQGGAGGAVVFGQVTEVHIDVEGTPGGGRGCGGAGVGPGHGGHIPALQKAGRPVAELGGCRLCAAQQ